MSALLFLAGTCELTRLARFVLPPNDRPDFESCLCCSWNRRLESRELGADFCFDYSDTEVVPKVRAAVSGKRLSHVFDTVGAGVFAQGVEFEKSSVALAAKCVSGSGDELKFGCVLPVPGDRRWTMCLATRDGKFPLPPHMPPTPTEWPDRTKKAWAWATANYGKGQFRIPNVRTVHGAEKGMEAMKWSAEGKSSLEKIVIEHPL